LHLSTLPPAAPIVGFGGQVNQSTIQLFRLLRQLADSSDKPTNQLFNYSTLQPFRLLRQLADSSDKLTTQPFDFSTELTIY
jgi:hypothetical protein